MSIYHYKDGSLVDRVSFRKTANGSLRAYVHTDANADSATTQSIKKALTRNGYQWTPFDSNLEVRKVGSEAKLLKLLRQNKWTKGKVGIELEKEDHITWMDWFKKRTLQASGAVYLIGDYGFWKYNRKEADKLGMAGAFSYFLGTLALVFYGRNDQSDLQVKALAKDVKEFANGLDIKPPEGSALHEITTEKRKSVFQKFNDFCTRYPSEIFNSVTALAGVFVGLSAYFGKIKGIPKPGMDPEGILKMRKEGQWDLGLGVLTALSGTLATLVKEKKPDPDDPPAKGLKWLWQKIREHPLAISGIGYTMSTACHAKSTWDAYWDAKRRKDHERLSSIPGRALFVGAALTSEALLSISSKGHGEGVVSDQSVDQSAIALTADLIVRQPLGKQDELIAKFGKFLGDHNELGMEDSKITETLRHQVETMRKSAWAKATNVKNKQPVIPAPEKNEKPVWQTKYANEAKEPQLQRPA